MESPPADGAPAQRSTMEMNPNPYSSHRLLADLAGTGHRVLDVGSGEGALALELTQRGNTVVCLEIDPARAAIARSRGLEVHEINIEREGIEKLGAFDVVLCGDVIEHLLDPAAALQRLKASLAPGGRLLVSIPNIAFYAIRARLLLGQFKYTDAGILDRTHLHFYTHATSRRLLEDAGLRIRRETITLAPPTSAVPGVERRWYALLGRKAIGRAIHRAMRLLPGLFASQFVYEAAPAGP